MPPLPDWFVAEVKRHFDQGHSAGVTATSMTKKYAIVVHTDEVLMAIRQGK